MPRSAQRSTSACTSARDATAPDGLLGELKMTPLAPCSWAARASVSASCTKPRSGIASTTTGSPPAMVTSAG